MPLQTEHAGAVVSHRNDWELTFYALRRSGHHAIMLWTAHHFGLPVCVLNDVKPYSDPYLTATFTDDWDRDSSWVTPLRDNFEEVRLRRKDCLMISVQDFDLQRMADCDDVFLDREKMLGRSRKRFTILALRDPFNLLASRLAKPVPLLELLDPTAVLNAWEVYAQEFIGMTSFLGSRVNVNFNLWFSNCEYRQSLASQLGLAFTDAGLDVVPRAGGGSSFDLLRYDGKGSQMRVLERWKHFEDDKHFRAAFRGREQLGQLCSQLFDFDSALSKFSRDVLR